MTSGSALFIAEMVKRASWEETAASLALGNAIGPAIGLVSARMNVNLRGITI